MTTRYFKRGVRIKELLTILRSINDIRVEIAGKNTWNVEVMYDDTKFMHNTIKNNLEALHFNRGEVVM